MKFETKKQRNMMIKPSVVKLAEKLQKKRRASSFSELVEILILEEVERSK